MGPLKRVALAALALGLALGGAPARAQERVAAQNAAWTLGTMEVVSAGRARTTKVGRLVTGYVLRAPATARGASPIASGTWRLTLTAFQPAKDMPGQKAGRWYVRGDWTLTGPRAPAPEVKARHARDQMKGIVLGELPFDPTTATTAWTAAARLPKSTISGKWGKGNGTLNVNPNQGGELSLALAR
jgi:hypothetical protein